MGQLGSGVRVLVTGSGGFVGSNLVPLLRATGAEIVTVTRKDYDLTEQADVRRMLAAIQPQVVVHLAGLVGGILANRDRPAEYSYVNLAMTAMMLHESFTHGVAKYVTLMGGCSYPAKAANPISETSLFEGYPQSESAPYSLGKAMSAVLGGAYRQQHGFNAVTLVPGNLYGPHDNFHPTASHVIPAMLRRFVEARETGAPAVTMWGTGRAVRDFVYVGDACEAIVRAILTYDASDLINISSGVPVTIRELADMVRDVVGYEGEIRWDSSKPDGQLEKLFDVRRMRERLGFEPQTTLRAGLEATLAWYEARQRAPAESR
jgi:GDP-L-fucose synthase